ncbi:MAG: GNAT family N-acetyltransferase [Bacteroidales bacterium]|nr:GNAT family N-acetyltransferase [Bacteroidales bacterium]MDD4210087.1 GNAT family N-acetyltransferase [Bacteroidales bacterium]
MVEKILKRIHRRLIKSELTDDKLICATNYGSNLIYSINCFDAPNTLLELGRLREYAFRDAGDGTGKSIDLDEFDISNPPFQQLIVWDPKEKEIISSYRYILGKDIKIDKHGIHSPTAKLFKFSNNFIQNYLPYSMELGRSFVQPQYQVSRSRKGLFALDNIWDGLGAIMYKHPEIKYVYGKMTMYKSYNPFARDLILFFLNKHFSKGELLMEAYTPQKYYHDANSLAALFPNDNFKDDYKSLVHEVDKLGCKIPPLVNIYMKVASTMQCFGTSDNEEFGDTEETVILIKIDDIYEEKKARHLNPKSFKSLNDYKNLIFRKKQS